MNCFLDLLFQSAAIVIAGFEKILCLAFLFVLNVATVRANSNIVCILSFLCHMQMEIALEELTIVLYPNLRNNMAGKMIEWGLIWISSSCRKGSNVQLRSRYTWYVFVLCLECPCFLLTQQNKLFGPCLYCECPEMTVGMVRR